MAAPDLGQRARRRQPGLHGDPQQVGDVGELAGHPLATPARAAPQPEVGREEGGHGRPRDDECAQPAGQRRGDRQREQQRDGRRTALHRHDVGSADAAAHARRVQPVGEVGRRGRRAGTAPEGGQPYGQRTAPRRPRATHAQGAASPAATAAAASSTTPAAARTAAATARRRATLTARSGGWRGSRRGRGRRRPRPARRSGATTPGRRGTPDSPTSARPAAATGIRTMSQAVKRACAVAPRASASSRARSSSVCAIARRSATRSPPASRCRRIAATSVSHPGSCGAGAQPLEDDVGPLAQLERARGVAELAPRGAGGPAGLGRRDERAADRVAGGQRVGHRPRQRGRVRRRARPARRGGGPPARGPRPRAPRRPAPRRPTARRRASPLPAVSRPRRRRAGGAPRTSAPGRCSPPPAGARGHGPPRGRRQPARRRPVPPTRRARWRPRRAPRAARSCSARDRPASAQQGGARGERHGPRQHRAGPPAPSSAAAGPPAMAGRQTGRPRRWW